MKALRKQGIRVSILTTAQHRSLLDQMMATFGLRVDWDLNAMQPNQTLASLAGRLVPALGMVPREGKPDSVLAQGDITTAFCTSLESFYAGIPFGRLEADLRSGDLSAPFPEEGMRRLSAVVFQKVTERPEAVEFGGVLLVGSDTERFQILSESLRTSKETYQAMGRPCFHYGDGQAGYRIASLLKTSPDGAAFPNTSGCLPAVSHV